jgi:hypothetical protein
MVHLGCLDGMKPVGDLCDVRVGVYVALDNQLSRLFTDGTEIAGLFLLLLLRRTRLVVVNATKR